MTQGNNQKVTGSHLGRSAYLYIRQSTVRQVFENTESTKRQYALRQRAIALGWPLDRINVIDQDLGHSGASAADREGFQKLVSEVGLGRAGIVLGLEVSRLARNSTDWHKLLEICGLTNTLILDEDGIYDPSDFNDRLLLGLKGTMSEAELHFLRARLRGGLLNKARRGELKMRLPIGLMYTLDDRVVLDPDQRVQETLRFFFQSFRQTGSATATVKLFRKQRVLFPRRIREGARKGEVAWGPLLHTRVLHALHNPRYAGAFVFGRTRSRKLKNGGVSIQPLPQNEWQIVIPDSHPGYLSFAEYEENVKQLRDNARSYGLDRKSPPREGPALLQGLVVCGVCGNRMTLRYHTRHGKQRPDYVCQRAAIEHGTKKCQVIPGTEIDTTISQLLLDKMTPATLEVSLAVQNELQARMQETDRLRKQCVETARYEVELAERRYLQVDPGNRLVAGELEAEWNRKLLVLREAQEQYERKTREDAVALGETTRKRILALATDFPRLWNDPKTAPRDRKRMARLLLEDVTLIKGNELTIHVRFKGGTTQTITQPKAQSAAELRKTDPRLVHELDRLLDQHTDAEVAELLNTKSWRTGTGRALTAKKVRWITRTYGLAPRFERLRAKGYLTLSEVAERLCVSPNTVKIWRRNRLLHGHPFNEKGECLFELPREGIPKKQQGQKLAERARYPEVLSDPTNEVQYGS